MTATDAVAAAIADLTPREQPLLPTDGADVATSSAGEKGSNFIKQYLKKQVSWLHIGYLGDWIITLVLLGVAELIFGFTKIIAPFARAGPFANDPTLRYPYLPDIIPVWLLIVLGFGIPVVVVIIMQLLRGPLLHDVHHAVLGFISAFAMEEFLVNIFKLMAGQYRPHYLTLCNPSPSLPANHRITDADCRTPAADLKHLLDAHLSFPSGHAAVIFCCMVFLSLYLLGKYRVLGECNRDRAAQAPSNLVGYVRHYILEHKATIKLFACLSPLVLALFVAVSRTMDYHHHFQDIIAGALIGILCGATGYLHYFHVPTHKNSDKPKMNYHSGHWSVIAKLKKSSAKSVAAEQAATADAGQGQDESSNISNQLV